MTAWAGEKAHAGRSPALDRYGHPGESLLQEDGHDQKDTLHRL